MERVKQMISKDGKYRLDIELCFGGLYRYVTSDDRYRNDADFRVPPEWTIDEISGFYASAKAAEDDAVSKIAWLRG